MGDRIIIALSADQCDCANLGNRKKTLLSYINHFDSFVNFTGTGSLLEYRRVPKMAKHTKIWCSRVTRFIIKLHLYPVQADVVFRLISSFYMN